MKLNPIMHHRLQEQQFSGIVQRLFDLKADNTLDRNSKFAKIGIWPVLDLARTAEGGTKKNYPIAPRCLIWGVHGEGCSIA